jgi:PKD domain
MSKQATLAAVLLALIATLAWSVTAEAAPNAKSAATIMASFGASCTDFEAHSSKDISHVEVHYTDDRVVKNEDIAGADFSIDGDTGDEIDFAIVKTGTTSEHFACESPLADSPPNAVLERRAGASDHQNPAGTWTDTDCHSDFNNPEATFCIYGSVVAEPVSFRGTGSTDPDGDIVSWSIDFGDGTTPASGTWATDPPAEISHDYGQLGCVCTVVLTITDSAGHSSSDPMLVDVDNDPGFD